MKYLNVKNILKVGEKTGRVGESYVCTYVKSYEVRHENHVTLHMENGNGNEY